MWSIRRRLLVWLLSGVVLATVAAALGLYVQVRDEVDEVFDRQLKQIVLSLRSQPDLGIAAPSAAAEEEAEDAIVTSAWGRDGKPLFGLARTRPAPLAEGTGFTVRVWDNQSWRTYVAKGSPGTVEAAQPLLARRRIALDMVMRILWPIGALLAVLVVLVYIGVSRALGPLAVIAGALSCRSGAEFGPLESTNAPIEVAPFVTALNELLRRLRQQMAKQQQFVADAAHELRTPLAALQLQLDLAQAAEGETEREAALKRLRTGLERLIHLTRQLLTMARSDPQPATLAPETASLSEVVLDVMGQLWPLAKAKDIDFGGEVAGRLFVRGDAEALRIMISNIMDNAIRYTGNGGRVDVNLRREQDQLVFEVTDTGPGIPVGERERVFDRFYRGSNQSVEGSGLGLAIVKSIAERHRALIRVQEGPAGQGVHFSVCFEASEGTFRRNVNRLHPDPTNLSTGA